MKIRLQKILQFKLFFGTDKSHPHAFAWFKNFHNSEYEFKNFKILPTQENFVLPKKPARGLNCQVAHGSTIDSYWSNNISDENMYVKTLPIEIIPQDICEDNGMTNWSFGYSDDELALARSLHTLKSTNVQTDNEPKETSEDES